jgi:hypothetical protein
MVVTKWWQWWVLVLLVGVVIITYIHTQDSINLLLSTQQQVREKHVSCITTLLWRHPETFL